MWYWSYVSWVTNDQKLESKNWNTDKKEEKKNTEAIAKLFLLYTNAINKNIGTENISSNKLLNPLTVYC